MFDLLRIARFTVEARSPVMIAGGGDDPLLDVLLARDVNGLPMLPATSLAGVLRHGFTDFEQKNFFGFQNGDEGQSSQLIFTDGLFHWSDNQPRDGVVFDQRCISADEIVRFCQKPSPVSRDHVKLNEAGVVSGDGKFERSATPTGSRFTFEISQRGENGEALKAVVERVKQGLHLGGATRSGYGELACILAGVEKIDLRSAGGRERFAKLAAQDLQSRNIVMEVQCGSPKRNSWCCAGTIEGPLLIGSISGDSKLDRTYFKEQQIKWDDGAAILSEVAIIPGSAIKGALRHRVLFHLRQLGHADALTATNQLFGSPTKGGKGQAGALRFSDVQVDNPVSFEMIHVGLDRFTGGSRQGVLFTDEMLWQPELCFQIERLVEFACDDSRNAFRAALEDFNAGRLGIGADWGDGVGIFSGLRVSPPTGPEVGG